jgi:hypothetical protein
MIYILFSGIELDFRENVIATDSFARVRAIGGSTGYSEWSVMVSLMASLSPSPLPSPNRIGSNGI